MCLVTICKDSCCSTCRDIVDSLASRPATTNLKVAQYSFSGSIPPKFEHKLRRHKQSFGKITTPVVLDKDENLL